MRRPARRRVLGAAATVLVAGCLGGDSGGRDESTASASATATTGPSPSATTTATAAALGTERTVGGVPVRISNLTVQDAVLYLDSPDSMAVESREDERYVVVSVAATPSGDGAAPPASAVDLSLDGERVGVADVRAGLDDRAARYDPSIGVAEGYLPFLVPVGVDVTEAQVVVEHGDDSAAWELEEAHLTALRRPKARFELRDVDIPSTITADEPVSVRVAAENISGVVGVFRGVLNVAGLGAAYVPYAFSLDAEPGETVVWEKRFDEHPPEGAESVGFYLKTVVGERSVEAAVGNGTARTESATVTQ